MNRRAAAALLLVALAVPSASISQQQSADSKTFRVTLLGTGSPILSAERFGPSTLVEAGDQKLLFDCGRGATIRLAQIKVPLREVKVFLTHLHSDHVNGLTDLWLTGWLPPGGSRATAFQIWGPTGTGEMISYLEKAHQADIRIRIADQHLPISGIAIHATDITEGIVYERDGVRVSAFDVDHGDAIKPALGYRVDYGGRSVVISGDTRVSPNLIKHSKSADVIIHEVMGADAGYLARSESARIIMAHHTRAEEAGRVFSQIKPKLAVYSHIALSGDAKTAAPSTIDLIRQTRTAYSGPLEVGENLMMIEVNDAPTARRFHP